MDASGMIPGVHAPQEAVPLGGQPSSSLSEKSIEEVHTAISRRVNTVNTGLRIDTLGTFSVLSSESPGSTEEHIDMPTQPVVLEEESEQDLEDQLHDEMLEGPAGLHDEMLEDGDLARNYGSETNGSETNINNTQILQIAQVLANLVREDLRKTVREEIARDDLVKSLKEEFNKCSQQFYDRINDRINQQKEREEKKEKEEQKEKEEKKEKKEKDEKKQATTTKRRTPLRLQALANRQANPERFTAPNPVATPARNPWANTFDDTNPRSFIFAMGFGSAGDRYQAEKDNDRRSPLRRHTTSQRRGDDEDGGPDLASLAQMAAMEAFGLPPRPPTAPPKPPGSPEALQKHRLHIQDRGSDSDDNASKVSQATGRRSFFSTGQRPSHQQQAQQQQQQQPRQRQQRTRRERLPTWLKERLQATGRLTWNVAAASLGGGSRPRTPPMSSCAAAEKEPLTDAPDGASSAACCSHQVPASNPQSLSNMQKAITHPSPSFAATGKAVLPSSVPSPRLQGILPGGTPQQVSGCHTPQEGVASVGDFSQAIFSNDDPEYLRAISGESHNVEIGEQSAVTVECEAHGASNKTFECEALQDGQWSYRDIFTNIESYLYEQDLTSTKSETGLTDEESQAECSRYEEMFTEWAMRLSLQDEDFAVALAHEAEEGSNEPEAADGVPDKRKWYEPYLEPYLPYLEAAMRCFVYLASPAVGILPWSLNYPWLSTLYQWIVLTIYAAAVAHAGQTCYEEYYDRGNVIQSIVYTGDAILATGALAGLFCCGAYWQSCTLVRCIQLLQAWSDQTAFLFDWEEMSLKDFGISLGVWFVCMVLRCKDTILYFEPPTIHVVYFGMASALLMGMSGFVLHTCTCLSNMADAFCYRVVEDAKFTAAQMEWSLLQSLCRASCSRIQWLFLSLEATMMCIALLMITQVSHNEISRLTNQLPGVIIAMTVMRVSIAAATVTDKCARVPALVNSVSVGSETDQEKMFCVHYIHYSRAGFYIGEILLTSSTILKTVYVLCAVAFGLATQVL